MATVEQTFDEAVQEYIEKTDEVMGVESPENFPPPPPAPFPHSGPPVHSAISFRSENIRRYAYSIGDDNPIFTDPEYGANSPYGTQIAPGPMLAMVRYPSAHGAARPQGYPVANFISGAAWEFYDVIRVGSRFTSSKVAKEHFEKGGAQGRLLFLIAEVKYWDQTGELKAKCYGTQIHVPIREMESGRAMKAENVGQHMMYNRPTPRYDDQQVADLVEQMKNMKRQGAEPRYWEDVQEGDELPTYLLPPFTLHDQIAYHQMGYSITSSRTDHDRDARAFSQAYKRARRRPDFVRTNPVTRWPWAPGAEHEDVILAAYRGQPGPFDYGVQRAQIPQALMSNWMGDHGFLRKMYTAFRRPVFYGDATFYNGTVKKKYTVTEDGSGHPGVPGKQTYHAVAIEIAGTNQAGEMQCPGFATVYLPSREHGPVVLPVPHESDPPFVPYDTYRRIDWY